MSIASAVTVLGGIIFPVHLGNNAEPCLHATEVVLVNAVTWDKITENENIVPDVALLAKFVNVMVAEVVPDGKEIIIVDELTVEKSTAIVAAVPEIPVTVYVLSTKGMGDQVAFVPSVVRNLPPAPDWLGNEIGIVPQVAVDPSVVRNLPLLLVCVGSVIGAAADTQVDPLLVRILPFVPGATTCNALVPLPNRTLLAVNEVDPVPPLPTGKIPLIFVVNEQYVVEVDPVPPLPTGKIPLIFVVNEQYVVEVDPVPPLAIGKALPKLNVGIVTV